MRVVIDTGPWVALIDRSEGMHAECVSWFRKFDGEIYSSEAVLTEVLYLLNFSNLAQSAAIEFLLEGAITLVPASVESLKTVKELMRKYIDLPMNFADATLVSMAQDLGIYDAVTLDKKHFNIYRVRGKTFSVLPE